VVNNSWGGGGGDTWYQAKVQAWVAAGVFPAFSAGNSGSGCSTLGSPGDYQESFGSAAHDSGRNIAGFSSRGPSAFGDDPYTKPNISAPGVSVCSSVPTDGWDCGYSGTSMASPHTAGAVALLWSCNPGLVGQIDQTFQILQTAANTPPAGNCGAPPDGEGNYTFGYGYLDILAAGMSWCGDIGYVEGYVTDSVSGDPLEGAEVTALPALEGHATVDAVTDPTGFYHMGVLAGTYDITAAAFGYFPDTAAGVVVAADQTVTQDFALDAAPSHLVFGYVTDANTGWPLYASIAIDGYPYGSIWTNPLTGYYQVDLPEGMVFTMTASAWSGGYLDEVVAIGPLTGDTQQDFELDVDPVSCSAPGYGYTVPTTLYTEDFEGGYADWTMTGLWNAESQADTCGAMVAPFPSPSNAAYYGIDGTCTYNNGAANSGDLTQASPLALPAGSAFWLEASSYSQTECGGDCGYDLRSLQISNDGVNFADLGHVDFENAWGTQTFNISSYAGQSVYLRFHFDTGDDIANDFFGWMLDDVQVLQAQCLPSAGGLVSGNVYDNNTGAGLAGADVTNDEGGSFTAVATPDDPALDDGFYLLFTSPGDHGFTATMAAYADDLATVTVVDGENVDQDFYLGAGWLSTDPDNMHVTLDMGANTTLPLSLTNGGAVDAAFEIGEQDRGFTPALLKDGSGEWLYRAEWGADADQPWHGGAGLPVGLSLDSRAGFSKRAQHPDLC
jgi:hypothetical protein